MRSSMVNTLYANQAYNQAIRSTANEEGFGVVQNIDHFIKLSSDEGYQRSVTSYRRMENTAKLNQSMIVAGSYQQRVFGISRFAPTSEDKLSLHTFMDRISMVPSSEFLVNSVM